MPKQGLPFRSLLTLAVAVGVGAVFDAFGVPLGWLVGAMLATACASLFRFPQFQPKPVMPYARGAVGTMLGASVTPGVFAALTEWWPSLLMMSALMMTGVIGNYRILRRWFGFQSMDAALCAMPGGIAEMIVLGEQAGADARRVAIVQALRIALSILIIPVVAGWAFHLSVTSDGGGTSVSMTVTDWLWFAGCVVSGVLADRWLKALPAGFVLVPMALSAALHLSGTSDFLIPPIVSITVQVVIGMNVGARFLGFSLRELARVALSAAVIVGVQIILAVTAAMAMGRAGRGDALALMLAYAPGGLAEMSLIAIGMGREVAFVAFHHILRVLTALLLAPPILKRLGKGAT